MDHIHQLAQTRGYFLRREAVALGLDDRQLTRGVRTGRYVRIRQGAYTLRTLWAAASASQRHIWRVLAAQDLTIGATAISHVSALAVLGAPLWGVDLRAVHLTRLDGSSSRIEAGTIHHDGHLPAADVVLIDGRRVTTPTRSLVDALTRVSIESGMVAGDWLLHHELTDHDALWRMKARMQHWPGTLKHEIALRLLDGRSESVGETRGRNLFRHMGLPAPELQVPVCDEAGRLIGITDYGWAARGVYGEFDGQVKYGRLLKEGQSAGDVVFAEKRREDAIRRATGGTVVRFTWSDLHPTSEPARQLSGLLRRSA